MTRAVKIQHKQGVSCRKKGSAQKANAWGMSRECRSQLECAPNDQRWKYVSNQKSSVGQDYPPKYEVNIHVSILIQVTE